MIKAGDTLPSLTLTQATDDGPKPITTDDLFRGKTVVLFGVPGAFTPTCSARHLPSFKEQGEALRAKGVETVACIAVNDAFVMQAWKRDQQVGDEILMLADGSAEFTRAVGLELDLGSRGLGTRSKRFALVAKDGKVTHVAVEEGTGFEVSGGQHILAAL